MDEALAFAKKHANHTKDYKLYFKKDEGAVIHFKRVDHTNIGKLDLIIPNPDCYDDIISLLMDPNGPKKLYNTFADGTISQVYNKNLLIVRQQYQSTWETWRRHCYALINKTELSDDETAVLFVSLNTDYYNSKIKTKQVNPIIKSAISFNPGIDTSKDLLRNELSKKMYINLAAFFIKKEANCIKVTYLSSIDMNFSATASERTNVKIAAKDILQVVKLRNIFKSNKNTSQ
ncbi:fam-a protein [Plasmodium vinckei petteri]|nr:fam-a protein [Plasmodium vinckei petteri]